VDSRTGFVMAPTYHFARTQAGGTAKRIDFLGPQRLHADAANYSSCTREPGQTPGWELSMDELDIDVANNEGRAKGAVLRFLGVPILAAPVLSFPASDAPKSGWLPPSFGIDTRAGVEITEPYYWRIASDQDLTLTPVLSSRRGAALRSEYRYLQPSDAGRLEFHLLPWDRIARARRYSVQADHEGSVGEGLRYELHWQDASDDAYWKDFSRLLPSLTPRLLPQQAGLGQRWTVGQGEVQAYARMQGWRVLQDTATPISVPYGRVPQVGVRWLGRVAGGLEFGLETEVNRFSLHDRVASDTRSDGDRAHLLTTVARPADLGWAWFTPQLALNSAAYRTDTAMSDGRSRAERTIPTLSVDTGLRFDRPVSWFGADALQTLEPRLHYVQTPWIDQSALPLFDTAASDFNELSIYADNAFTGVDRVSDAQQITLGATSRVISAGSGRERVRFGAAQRFQFRDQHLTADSLPGTSRASDLLLFASGSLPRGWHMDTTLQYNPELGRTMRSIVSARYQPGPFQTISGTYRYARELSEQFELGFQWPVLRGKGAAAADGSCSGSLYAVGRVNYSVKDDRITDTVFGVEYDAGCWITRVVYERISTGQSEATRRLMLQLELVGLSRLGTNPLQVLKDNVPGYRLLRDTNAAPLSTVDP
jgi:LPS-assembly protein